MLVWKPARWGLACAVVQADSVHAAGEEEVGELAVDGGLGRCTHVLEVKVKGIGAVDGGLRLASFYLRDGHVERL